MQQIGVPAAPKATPPAPATKLVPSSTPLESSEGATEWLVVGVVIGLVAAAVAAVMLRRRCTSRRGAFEDLAGLLRLSRVEQDTVRQMAAAGGVVEPVALLVSAEKMREAAQAYLQIAAGADTPTRTQRLLTKVHGN